MSDPQEPTARELLDIDLARLSFSDLRALWEFTGGKNGREWSDLQHVAYSAMHERALKFVERVRMLKAEEAQSATS